MKLQDVVIRVAMFFESDVDVWPRSPGRFRHLTCWTRVSNATRKENQDKVFISFFNSPAGLVEGRAEPRHYLTKIKYKETSYGVVAEIFKNFLYIGKVYAIVKQRWILLLTHALAG